MKIQAKRNYWWYLGSSLWIKINLGVPTPTIDSPMNWTPVIVIIISLVVVNIVSIIKVFLACSSIKWHKQFGYPHNIDHQTICFHRKVLQYNRIKSSVETSFKSWQSAQPENVVTEVQESSWHSSDHSNPAISMATWCENRIDPWDHRPLRLNVQQRTP